MSFKIFELTHTCNEGYDGADMLFFAYDEMQVAESILDEIKKYAKSGDENSKGYKYICILETMNPKCIGNVINKDIKNYNDDDLRFAKLITKTMTGEMLLDAMAQSNVDGDSYFQVGLHEYKLDNVVQLTSEKHHVAV